MRFTDLYRLSLLSTLASAAANLRSAAGASPGSGPSCQQACETLASEFPGRLHYGPSDTNFTIWDQKQLQTVYTCRVEPASADEVSTILSVLVDNWCQFAVKCGGHSRYPGDSVSVGGVTIDLGLLNSTVVSEDRTTAAIGGGSLTRQVFAALDPYGLAYVGGRVGQVGMGGYILGGGTSVLSAKYGWALDHVLEYEVVLPNATIVTVSESSHPDLYYVLRGGGNNYGIVTSFNVSVFPQNPVYTGSRSYGDDQTGPFLEEAEKIFSIEDHEDTNVGLEYRYTYSTQSGWTMSSTQRYAQPVMNPSVFDALNSIPALGNLTGGIGTLASSTSFHEQLGTTRNVFASLTHYPSVELGKKGLAILKRNVVAANLTSLNPQLITYSIPAATMEMSKVRGGNALGLDVEGHLVINLLSLSWTDSAMDNSAYALADSFIADFREAAESANASHPFIYINYANKGQDVFAGYGKENQQRLVEIQQAIDPRGVFTSSGLWTGFFKVR
ncbi:FAD binding domain-containing protein [Pleurostoma richardsiae]|uniref:FAD binding domain-containing protein n=1 Tax=Pleurostoma richardsiae TaxID=41990 RepID=A0AA38RH92_9PEZI|nr:FAD binding domain-containing protein [Pleurostoma richardsiae]